MEFIKQRRHRSVLSEAIYIALNIALAVAILLLVLVANTPLPALALVLLSKWRMLAVRMRFWAANVQSNLVDLIVSISYVVFLVTATGAVWLQVLLMVAFALWLVLLKPRSRQGYMVAQAAVALGAGTTTVSLVAYDAWASLSTVLMWVIGYATTRHALLAYKQQAHIAFLSLVGGLVMAELGWLTYHWTIAYAITPGIVLQLPQVTIIACMIGLIVERSYASYNRHDGIVKRGDVVFPILMAVSVLLVILALFNASASSLR